MKLKNYHNFIFLIAISLPIATQANSANPSVDPQLKIKKPKATSSKAVAKPTTEEESQIEACANAAEFSHINYETLTKKLDGVLKEKNKSLIFLDYKTLQAQVDVLVNHLLSVDTSDKKRTLSLLEKTLAYLEQLEKLLRKTKNTARMIKEKHVIPLATMTSLKSEADKCGGVDSAYSDIFKTLSQLNLDLTEILMISRQQIISQKNKVVTIIEKIENDKSSALSLAGVSSHLNFIQMQINSITRTFQFDTKSLNVAQQDISTKTNEGT